MHLVKFHLFHSPWSFWQEKKITLQIDFPFFMNLLHSVLLPSPHRLYRLLNIIVSIAMLLFTSHGTLRVQGTDSMCILCLNAFLFYEPLNSYNAPKVKSAYIFYLYGLNYPNINIYSVVHKKVTALLSSSLAWQAWAGCRQAELFSQHGTNFFAQPCRLPLHRVHRLFCEYA